MSTEDLGIEDGDGYTALITALVYERSKLALYLYPLTSLNHDDLVLVEKRRQGAMLLNRAISSRNLDLALHLIRLYPSLTHALDDRGESPLLALASMRNAFPSGNRLVFWKQWIYNCICIHPSALGTTIETRLNTPNVESGNQSAPATFETRLNIPNVENGRQRNQVITRIKSVTAVLLRHLISVVLYLWAVPAVLLRRLISVVLYLWAAPVLRRDLSSSIYVNDLVEAYLLLTGKMTIEDLAIGKAIMQLYEMKKLHIQSQELLSCMCEEISTSFIQTGQLENIGGVCDAITLAVKNGISEFVLKVARTHPSFLENKYRNSRNILMLAVLYRQSEIFSNIYHGFDMENTLTSYGDCNDDNILHMVGMIEDSTMLNQISGAALQMQRELQWFKIQELRLENPNDVSDDIYALACGPDPWVQSFSACIMNGTRFHTVSRGQHRRTQNSGVVVKGEHQSKAVDFYGVLHDILQLQYMGWHHVYWFKYEWFDVGDAKRGIHVGDHVTSVNTSRKWYKGKPLALVCQATQVFYLQDNSKHGNWAVVQRVTSRNMYNVPTTPLETKDDDYEQNLNFEAFQENEPSYMVAEPENGSDGISSPLHRTDGELIDVVADTIFQQGISLPDDEDFIDDETDSGNSSENGDVRLPVM
ncbi:uncharacterized protein LOC122294369 isoform X3 [Carya illinoinensis]|uniref:uncharacterized protein LOC122294369 isoform X3 n=1 Tax=Carya illinoinensis TaxID=32201 RepID=UPI001C723889|nr:uncharacterized protein LOC122294369 isoform X3 [Carya illinoinensis]